MKILYIDHNDSFTYNLISWFEKNLCEIKIIQSHDIDTSIQIKEYNGIIFSPGPGHPNDYYKSIDLYNKIPLTTPFLGICLGHQIFLSSQGGNIKQISKTPIHGRQVVPNINAKSNLISKRDIKGPYVLFNSLACSISDPIFSKNVISICSYEEWNLLAERQNSLHMGLQFHPESFASPYGYKILKAFLRLIQC